MNRMYVLLLPLRILYQVCDAWKPDRMTFSRKFRRRFLYGTAGLIGLRHVLWLTMRETVPYTRRQHQVLMPPVLERFLGAMVFKLVKQICIKGVPLPNTHQHVELVERIGTKITQAATELHQEGSCGHMQGLQWEFSVVENDQFNACVCPGGKMIMFSGLIETLSTDELAASMAHEVAHVVARHHSESITKQIVFSVAQLTIRVMWNLVLPPVFNEVFVVLPHSRRDETEADMIGIRLMAKAGFNPAAAVSMFRKLESLEQRSRRSIVPHVLRSHPVTSDRIECMQRELPKAMALFNQGDPLPNLWRQMNPLRWLRI